MSQPSDPYRSYALKWDGEWQITYETFRDMGIAYAVGLVLIYLLVVAQFGSYVTPLVIMAPIPLTIIGVMPGHALLGAPVHRDVDDRHDRAGRHHRAQLDPAGRLRRICRSREASRLHRRSSMRRPRGRSPIALTGLAAMLGAFFILDDPIFNGLAISLVFGILVSTLLTLVVIPVLYFAVNRHRHA